MTPWPSPSVFAWLPLAFACATPLPPVGEPSSTGSGDTTGSSSGADTTANSSSSGADTSTGPVDSSSSSSGDPTCGNGMIDEGETCDGKALPADADCMNEGFGNGIPGCVDDCSTLDYTSCPKYTQCGNGELGFGEECDGTNLAETTCDDFPNKTGDGLLCTDDCLFNTTNCMTCVETDEPCELMGAPCCNYPEETCVGLLGQRRCCVGDGLGGCV